MDGQAGRSPRRHGQARYLSILVPGLEQPARNYTLEKGHGPIELVLPGLIVYRSGAAPREVARLPIFNNSFLLLKEYTGSPPDPTLEGMIRDLSRPGGLHAPRIATLQHILPGDGGTFRIMAYDENRPSSIGGGTKNRLEDILRDMTNLTPDRGEPDHEFWILRRREGRGFFLFRLTKAGRRRTPRAGELSPQLASLLCVLSGPQDDDRFLDPFCGRGSIPLARACLAPYGLIRAVEKETDLVRTARERIRGVGHPRFRVLQGDALQLGRIEALDGKPFDCVVTDPPWGYHTDPGMNITRFYYLMLRELCRVTAPGATMVIVTARKREFESLLNAATGGAIERRGQYDILISGRKATAYRLTRR